MEKRECKRCLLFESGYENTLKSISEHISKIPEKEKTDSVNYEQRLSVCRQCDHLISGCCLKCGCYPEFRAAFVKQKCPLKKW